MPGSSSAAPLALLFVAGVAGAVPRAGLRIHSCPEALAREIRWLLEIELPGLQDPGWRGPQVVLRCAGELVTATALAPSGTRHLQRTLTLETVAPSARARLVALAAAELAAALEGRPSARASPPAPPRRWALTALATLGTVGDAYDLAYGGGVELDHRPWRHLGWRIALGLQHATSSVALGRAEAWLASVAAVLTVSRAVRWGRLTAGLGGRIGLCHLAGHADDPSAVDEGTVDGAWGGPHVLLEARLDVGRTLLSLGVEATYISLPVAGRVTGQEPYAVDHLSVLGRIGLGFSF